MLGFVICLSELEIEQPFGFGQEAAVHSFGSFFREIELWIYGPGQAQPSPSQGRAQQLGAGAGEGAGRDPKERGHLLPQEVPYFIES